MFEVVDRLLCLTIFSLVLFRDRIAIVVVPVLLVLVICFAEPQNIAKDYDLYGPETFNRVRSMAKLQGCRQRQVTQVAGRNMCFRIHKELKSKTRQDTSGPQIIALNLFLWRLRKRLWLEILVISCQMFQ